MIWYLIVLCQWSCLWIEVTYSNNFFKAFNMPIRYIRKNTDLDLYLHLGKNVQWSSTGLSLILGWYGHLQTALSHWKWINFTTCYNIALLYPEAFGVCVQISVMTFQDKHTSPLSFTHMAVWSSEENDSLTLIANVFYVGFNSSFFSKFLACIFGINQWMKKSLPISYLSYLLDWIRPMGGAVF